MDKRAKLSIHHIGGRSGTGVFPANNRFSDDFRWTFYEADKDCIEQIKTNTRHLGECQVLPRCIHGQEGKAAFHINLDPNTNSLLPFNQDFEDFSYFLLDPVAGPMDYRYGDAMGIVEKQALETTTLDHLFEEQELSAPDFLSLDTQGSEFAILQGAAKTLEKQTMAVLTEVEFQPIYQGQKLFGDIQAFLHQKGFQFARFVSLHQMAPSRETIENRGLGFHVFADGLFLKSPEFILKSSIPWLEKRLGLYKAAFIALSFQLFEFALICLRSAQAIPEPKDWPESGFLRFLDQLWRLSGKGAFPPTFAECYTPASSRARFAANQEPAFNLDLFSKSVDLLRRSLMVQGAKRLCLVPFGKFSRAFADKGIVVREDLCPVQFFDNFPKTEDSTRVEHAKTIGGDDFVLITSYAFFDEIKGKLVEAGVPPDHIFSLQDLMGIEAISLSPNEKEFNALEGFLAEHGFAEPARTLAQNRIFQGQFLSERDH